MIQEIVIAKPSPPFIHGCLPMRSQVTSTLPAAYVVSGEGNFWMDGEAQPRRMIGQHLDAAPPSKEEESKSFCYNSHSR